MNELIFSLQMLVCNVEDAPLLPEEEPKPAPTRKPEKVDKKFVWKHGGKTSLTYSNCMLTFLTKLAWGLPDIATPNVCKLDSKYCNVCISYKLI